MKGVSDVFVSIRGRVIVNVEALNMTESVGNYVKRRRVPVISPTTYATYFVPAISGESIAHGYQEVLAKKADQDTVCNLCKQGIFLKSTTSDVIKKSFNVQDGVQWLKSVIGNDITPDNIHEALEKAIISRCIVEDVGGFMYAERTFDGINVGSFRRTSCFSTGYMIPVKEAIENVVIEPQLHTRFVQGMPHEWQERYQVPYYVEISSAPYVFSFDLDTKYIGRLTFSYEKVGKPAINEEECEKRIEVALESLKHFLIEMMFGAKKTRFLPVIDWESIVIAISNDTWTTPSPSPANYIINTLNKLNKINNGTELFVYINPIVFEDTTTYVEKRTEELLNSFYKALEEFKKKLEERGDVNLINWNEFKKRRLEEFLERKVSELTESSDLKYASAIQEKYVKAKKELEAKGITVYESFEECVSEAVKKAKEKVKS